MVCHLQILVSRAYVRCGAKHTGPRHNIRCVAHQNTSGRGQFVCASGLGVGIRGGRVPLLGPLRPSAVPGRRHELRLPLVGCFHLLTTIMVSHLQILVSGANARCGVKLPAPDTTSDVSPIKILVGVGSLFCARLGSAAYVENGGDN